MQSSTVDSKDDSWTLTTFPWEDNSNIIHEAADVLYHLVVYLEGSNIRIEDVMIELDKRRS